MQTIDAIDFTPTWDAILPVLIALIERGDAKGKQIATDELRKMARLADVGAETVALQRKAQATGAIVHQTGALAGEWVR